MSMALSFFLEICPGAPIYKRAGPIFIESLIEICDPKLKRSIAMAHDFHESQV